MKNSTRLEIAVGLFVAAGLAALFVLAMKVSNITALTHQQGYELTVRFDNIGGLKVRSPVTMGGVRVGRVTDITYDDESYEAVVTLNVSQRYRRIPADSSASIFTSGLLGEQYVGIEPGGEERYLKDGDRIRLSQSALILEQVIGRVLFSKAAEGGQ
ncbi:MAG TPA: outer membrane lipid asymmetry maintenance protein MlaD [Gammaproteobacteria bacterium]|nr:outer membrane lipid asymmetry maintenance protein MlaD [Gammaproteobacteria bacterium]